MSLDLSTLSGSLCLCTCHQHPDHEKGQFKYCHNILQQHIRLLTAAGNAWQVCKFHINGGCQKGDVCSNLHVSLAAAPRVRQAWIAER